MAKTRRSIVVFDLGGVLIDWDPRHLYRKLFAGDETAMENFLATVCTHEWNRRQDAGRSFAEGARLLKAEHPNKAELIDAYGARFHEMMSGPIAGSVEILAELRARGTPLYLLSNFSAETFPPAFERFDFLRWFRGMVISGEVGVIKPDLRIYEIMLARFAIDPYRAVYIDDVAVNAEAAAGMGIHGIHFTTPAALRDELVGLDLLPPRIA
ncbi:MAG TPA: HAD family phosphatase [Stellaceae bacterium]